jgi:D-alanyl-D-alanine carboxypeptidase
VSSTNGGYVTVAGSRGLTPQTISQIERLFEQPGLSHTVVHQGTIDLTSVLRAGETVRTTPKGSGIPTSVLAVDPLAIELTMSTLVAATLSAGDVVMGASAAKLDGVFAGDELTMLTWSGKSVRIRVGAVSPDADVSGVEMVLTTSLAATLGLDRPFSVRVWGFDDHDAAEKAIEKFQLAWVGQAVRARTSWRTKTSDDQITQVQLKSLLGNFWVARGKVGALRVDPAWKSSHVAVIDLPIIGNVTCSKIVGKAAGEALQELRDLGLENLIKGKDSRKFGGCFSARVTRSLTGNSGHNLSRHAWGAAIDLNPSDNPYGGPSKMDQRVIDVFRRHGFVWGGTFLVPDPMHFEYVGM